MPPTRQIIQNSSVEDCGDVELHLRGDRFFVQPGPVLLSTGWRGGLWVRYVPGDYDFTVEASDGNTCTGFLLFQSEDYQPFPPPFGTGVGSPENYLAHQFLANGQGGQNIATIVAGGTRCYFKVYEQFQLNGGVRDPNLPITYVLNENLKVSENGFLCNDSDVELALAGVISPKVVGVCSAVPNPTNRNRLGFDLKY